MNYSEILQQARKDTEILSKINVDELVASLDTVNPYFENKTMTQISDIVSSVISELPGLTVEKQRKMCSVLVEYHYIEQIYQFQKGRYIRWLRKNTDPVKLTNGGVVMEIIFRDKGGTYILCMTNQRRPCQLRFDDCHFFQRLTEDEQLVLALSEHCSEES